MHKKVLICIETLQSGGAEKVLIDILNKLDYTKMTVDLLVFDKIGVYINDINNNVNVRYINKGVFVKLIRPFQRRILKYFPKILYRAYINKEYDVEIAFLEGPVTKFIANSTNNSKKICWVHTDLKNNHWTSYIFKNKLEEEKIYNKFNEIIHVSQYAKKNFNYIFTIEAKQRVINNPIISEEILSKGNKLQEKSDIFTIISVGRLVKEKGFDRLIKAHARLIKEFNHRLIIVGEGEEKDRIKELIKELGVKESVELVGYKRNPYKYISNSDLFVCSSRTEGYSLVVAEALILGTPVLSTNCLGPNEILMNGNYGNICDNSEVGIFEALREILSNKDEIENLRKKAKLSRENFNYKNSIIEIENLILE